MLDKERMGAAAQNTRQYLNDFHYQSTAHERSSEESSQILVIDGDCLDAAMFFKTRFPASKPVVLNMASQRNPGGGWKNGLVYFSLIDPLSLLFRCWCTGRKSPSTHQYVSMLRRSLSRIGRHT